MVDFCPIVKWSGIWMVVWKPDWKKPAYGPKISCFKWSAKSYNFTIWIPDTVSSIQMVTLIYFLKMSSPVFRKSCRLNCRLRPRPKPCPCFKQVKYNQELNIGQVWYSNGDVLTTHRSAYLCCQCGDSLVMRLAKVLGFGRDRLRYLATSPYHEVHLIWPTLMFQFWMAIRKPDTLSGIWIQDTVMIWNPETFEIQSFWRSDFK